MTRVRPWMLCAVLGLAACTRSYVLWSFHDGPAGGTRAWIQLHRARHFAFSPCPASRSISVIGTFTIDLPSLTATFERGGEAMGGGPRDEDGNVYRGERTGGEPGAGTLEYRIVRYDRWGGRTPLGTGPEPGTIGNEALVVDGGETWVTFLREPLLGCGSRAVARLRVRTGEVTRLGMPPDAGPDPGEWIWDYLFPVDGRTVVLVGRRRSAEGGLYSFRTWRGDFGTGKWEPAIEGCFRPIDRRGTLLEIREDRWLAAPTRLSEFAAEVIRDGRREVVNLRTIGDADVLFDTGHVVDQDGEAGEVVIRPLFGGAERRFGR